MAPQVETQYGTIAGERRGNHDAFRGIPYAKPPLGKLRFRAPEPPEPWAGVRDATQFGASAPQGGAFAPGVVPEGVQAEDSLFVNVFTPRADQGKRPVMVWVHGGAFTVGSSSLPIYDGGPLAELFDVVVVTFNYRLGALGFLAVGEAGARLGAVENRGLHDQLAALGWVRTNIERFGGDPDNVTVFGESAGGASVGLLVAMPCARGLFRRAIVQSGSDTLTDLPEAEARGFTRHALLKTLDLGEHQLERLEQLPLDAFMRAQASVESNWAGFPHFVPVRDSALLPDDPRALLASGRASDVPLIIGTNRDEWNLFALMTMADWARPLTEHDAIAAVAHVLPRDAHDAAPALLDAYRRSRRERGLMHDNRALLRAILGDRRFRMPCVRFAEQHLTRQPETFVYLFCYASPVFNGLLGACHALELPFVFGTTDSPRQDRFIGTGPEIPGLSRTMMEYWTSFARSGEPSAASVGPWARYAPDRRLTLELAATSQMVSDAFGEERRAWDGLI